MSDTIDRQAAIDGADAIIARDTSGNNDVVKAMTAWKEYINGLPSAQPDPPEWAKKVEHHLQNVPHYIVNPVRWALFQAYKEYDEKTVRK